MFGLDDWLAGMSDGGSVLVVLLVAVLLGLRHATDPDHIAAVTTLVVSGREGAARSVARLGAWWGLGHAVTLIVFGIPILLAERYLPERAQQGAETAVAALIVFLAVRLLLRWRHGAFATFPGGAPGVHRHGVRTRFGAFGVGLVHGMGGSASGMARSAAAKVRPSPVTPARPRPKAMVTKATTLATSPGSTPSLE